MGKVLGGSLIDMGLQTVSEVSRRKTARQKKRADECPLCEGRGESRNTRREMELSLPEPTAKKPRLVTRKMGSGCERCLGRGLLSVDPPR